jgi:ATP/maltotriose-dependent transcriptional regulator MalT
VYEPLTVSYFYATHAYVLTLHGRYKEAALSVRDGEAYSKRERLRFTVPFFRRIDAVVALGLRHFPRCRQLLARLEREGQQSDDPFVKLEARLLRARLFLAQGLHEKAISTLREQPERFPWESERGEYFAIWALALACIGNAGATRLAHEASSLGATVEIGVLVPFVRAVEALRAQEQRALEVAQQAFRSAHAIGNIDAFVTAYRAYPPLLEALAQKTENRPLLRTMLENANDTSLAAAKKCWDTRPRPRATGPLSTREHEVYGLLAQGLTNREIASALFISEGTAKAHIRHIYEKLGVRSRTEAVLKGADAE